VPGGRHRRAEEREILDRQQACLVRPVLEDPPGCEQARDGVARVRADAGAEREPVAAVDRRDRVELDGGEAADRLLDVRLTSAPEARRVALADDDEAAQRREADGRRRYAGARTETVRSAAALR